jgi:hypothetical protein
MMVFDFGEKGIKMVPRAQNSLLKTEAGATQRFLIFL